MNISRSINSRSTEMTNFNFVFSCFSCRYAPSNCWSIFCGFLHHRREEISNVSETMWNGAENFSHEFFIAIFNKRLKTQTRMEIRAAGMHLCIPMEILMFANSRSQSYGKPFRWLWREWICAHTCLFGERLRVCSAVDYAFLELSSREATTQCEGTSQTSNSREIASARSVFVAWN